MTNIILPELGDGISKAIIACWHIKPGQPVRQGDEILEVVTDKATFNVESPATGVLKNIYFKEGQEAGIAQILGVIE